jgi:formylglycine-generating enzyme required for sulfatase activity
VVTVTLQAGAEPVPGYRLLRPLGKGGFGEVWSAQGPGGFPVALKIIRLEGSGAALEMRSLTLMTQLRHAHLLDYFGAWRSADLLIIAMALADRTLLDRLRECQAQGLPGIPPGELLEYMQEAAKGIDYLNEARHTAEGKADVGIVHRDIKPANLLLVGGSVKVSDFGLAKLLEQTLASNSGSMTVTYAAPEFFEGHTSRFSDQYSLAVTYCQLRSGRFPFSGNIAQLSVGHLSQPPDLSMLPEGERAAVARALAKKPEDRWPSCRAFAQALAQPPAHAPGVPHTPRPQPTRQPLPQPVVARTTVEERPHSATPAAVPALQTALPTTVVAPQPPPAYRSPRSRGGQGGWWAAGAVSLVLVIVLLFLVLNQEKDSSRPKGALPNTGGKQKGSSNNSPPQVGGANPPVQPAEEIVNSIGMKLVRIPHGTFLMGSPETEEGHQKNEKQHEVAITKDFYLGMYLVTQKEFQRVMKYNPSCFSLDGTGRPGVNYILAPGEGKAMVVGSSETYPVESVSWHETKEFCEKLSALDAEQKAGRKYRLPTEAEWEYACRGGATSPFHFGNTISAKDANFLSSEYPYGGAAKSPSLQRTTKVGSYPANAFRLHDMHGNVWEWCEDWYDENYSTDPAARTDPQGPATGTFRVLRGGSYGDIGGYCRAAYRYCNDPSIHYFTVGFRVVLVVAPKTP